MTRVLESILAAKRQEVSALGRTPRSKCPTARNPLAVVSALARGRDEPLRLVTEIKRRSPSAGPLSTALSVGDRALAYARAGTAMISVLCDARFFDGGWNHVADARRALDDAGLAVPILAKEFIIDERQIDEAADVGADAVLLVVRIVDHARLPRLVDHARSLSLEPLVEVVTEDELAAAVDADAKVIGVNARDLDTLEMDVARAARVLSAVPSDRVAVHLSGLKTPDDVAAVARSNADAALVGEALMRCDDPTPLLRAMLAVTRLCPKRGATPR